MSRAPIFMLRTIASDGTLEKFLPDYASLDLSPVYCDSGTVKFVYPEKGVNFNLLKEDIEIAVTLNGAEVGELRCLIESIEGNNADDAEGGALWTFTARTAVGKLDDAVVYPPNWGSGSVLKKPKPVSYTNVNMGDIFISLFNKAKARGAMSRYTWDFTSSHDSEGNSWTYQVDLTIDAGKSYLDLLKEFNANGWLEFKVEKRVIRIWDMGKMGIDRSFGETPLHFRKGRDVSESPRKINTKGLRSTLLISGADSTVFEEIEDPTALGTYGRREAYYSAGSTKYSEIWGRISTLQLAGSSQLKGVSKPQMEVTHGLHFETEDNPRPVTNFNIGDWALTDVGQGVERFRILQWVISVAGDGSCTGSIVMNWLFNTQLSQVNSNINKLENGTINAGSAPKNDGVSPGQVVGVIPTSATYFVNSTPRDTLTVQWSALVTDEDGSDMYDLDYYQVQWKYTSDSGWRATQRVEQDTVVVAFANLDPGASVQVRVRAVDSWGNKGDWSSTVSHTLSGDTLAPQRPESPTLTSNVGTLRVVWSGLDFTGAPMPVDLAGVEVHISTSDFTPFWATKKDTLPPGVLSTTITQGLVYGTEYWVKLVAVDTTGNRSSPSSTTATTHVVLKQVVATEIGTGQVGLGQTTFSDVGNLIDDGTFELADNRATRTAAIGTQHLTFDSATSSNGNYSLRSDAWASATSESLKLQGSLPVKPGERVFGAADYRQTSDVPAGSFVTLAVKWLDKSGSYLDNTGAVSNVFYTLSDNGFTTKDNLWHSRISGTSQVAPANAVNAEIWIITTSRTAGTIWIDAVEVRKQIDTLMIAQAAITSALIANLAVNDAHIANVSAGKLTVGTLVADITLSARIKTANTGARAEINSGGFGLWDSAGTQTVAFAGADGSVRILGNLLSGSSGRRIDINPFATGLPEIRFYPNTGNNYGFMNAVSSGSEVSLGINSGQFSANGITSESRLYLVPGASALEVVRADNQTQNGPGLYLGNNWMSLNVNVGGNTGGSVQLNADNAVIGSDRGSTASALHYFGDTGKHFMIGEMSYFSDAQDALLMGHFDGTDGPVGGYFWTWGFTLSSTAYPVMTPFDNDTADYPVICSARSTTGFTIHFGGTGTVGAGYGVHFWAWRE